MHRDAPFNNLAPVETGAPRELGARERTSGRLQLALEPSSSVDLLVNVHAASNRGDSVGNKARGTRDPADRTRLCPDIGSSGDFTSQNTCVDINGANPSTSAWLDLNNVATARADVDTVGGFLRLSADLGGITLTSISSYDETEVKLADDIAGIQALQFAPHQDSRFEQFTQELRLVSPGDKSLRWILGAFYFRENLDQGTIVRRDNGGASTPGGEIAAFNLLDQEDEDVSGYGQLELDLTERFTLTGGLRYTHNDKSADSLFGVAIVPVALFPPGSTFTGTDLVLERTQGAAESCPPGPPGVDPQTGRRFGGPPPCLLPSLQPSQVIDRLGGKLGLDYRFGDDVMLYAGYSRGFKSGGFDTRALAAFNGDAGIPVDPEGLNAYELGLKSTWGDALVVNGAAFYYDQRDLQTFSVVNGVPGFFNIPRSKVLGLELESTWAPSDTSLVQASLGLIETEITDNGGLVGVDEEHVLPDAPKLTFNTLVAQDVPVGNANLQLQADARYVSEQIDALRFSQGFVSTKEPQFYLNVRALLGFGSERQFELAVFGENLTGEKFCADLGTVDDLSSTVQCQPGTLGKALWGVSLNARF